MATKRAKKKKASPGPPLPHLGDQILAALTREEIAQLLDALFEVSPPDSKDEALDRLPSNTRQTVQHILFPPAPAGPSKAAKTKPVSTARQAQTWSELWDEWHGVVAEAAQEEGDYIAQEAHWEPPYFDETAFVEDLEKIAAKMRPLLRTAFEHGFSPDAGFAQALLEAEEEVAEGLPEWMEIIDGFYLEENLTTCLLEWEWLAAVAEEQAPFAFARRVREWEDQVSYVSPNANTFTEFFTELPEEEQQVVFQGLNRHKEDRLWKKHLENTYSHWHSLYMYWVDRYAPDQYLVKLRATISQQWENGLTVIEDLLKKENYQESLAVIEETIQAMAERHRGTESWTPDSPLLFAHVSHFYPQDEYLRDYKALLRHYQKTAKGLGNTHLENALKIQHLSFNHFFNWQRMFKAFDESALPAPIRQALFRSWRDHIIQRTRPDSWVFGGTATGAAWWLHWLIESIAEPRKGAAYFQKQISAWLEGVYKSHLVPDEDLDFAFLRLLTRDLNEMDKKRRKDPYPQFYQVVIRSGELSTPDDASRQEYLKQFAPGDLLETVMAFWKDRLQEFVPSPRDVHQSDYTRHACWMAALKELAPRAFRSLLDQWRVEHERRRNLWKAMEERGLR